ncbi:hypothetical protein EU245_00590 [Lentibacillus lipolyticus]|nr:hypothetical protein EU245_00590 [Lentibacillus lipolyticus]
MKRIGFYFFIILFLISVYKDLTAGILPDTPVNEYPAEKVERESLTGVNVQVDKGDTVLSVVEELNGQQKKLNITQIMEDFKTLNPDENPLRIVPDEYYYFPLYERGAE